MTMSAILPWRSIPHFLLSILSWRDYKIIPSVEISSAHPLLNYETDIASQRGRRMKSSLPLCSRQMRSHFAAFSDPSNESLSHYLVKPPRSSIFPDVVIRLGRLIIDIEWSSVRRVAEKCRVLILDIPKSLYL